MKQLILPESEALVAIGAELFEGALDSVVDVTHMPDPRVHTQSDFIRRVVAGVCSSPSRQTGGKGEPTHIELDQPFPRCS
jgi:hypothetical protein